MSDGIRCMWMRGGTSKGGYFLAEDLPTNPIERNALLLNIMGSPDSRQIDGMGGADSLTSKVAIVSEATRAGIDVDYLFLQVAVEQPLVLNGQNCGNILAGVGAFAIERGLLDVKGDTTSVAIFMENTGKEAIATVQTPNGKVCYKGDTRIDGVPGTAAPVSLEFKDIAGSTCGALLPTGNAFDIVDGTPVTMIDHGMPCVILRAQDVGITGQESREELDSNSDLKEKLEAIRLKCGPLMNLGNVKDKMIPKMTMVSNPTHGESISTRTFIPHRCHASIGVLGAISVASGCLIESTTAFDIAKITSGDEKTLSIGHPSGEVSVLIRMKGNEVYSTSIVRTANKLMEGVVFP